MTHETIVPTAAIPRERPERHHARIFGHVRAGLLDGSRVTTLPAACPDACRRAFRRQTVS
ncbi:hypothetical protein [Actinoallomurus acaciae]|uniref:Uncharacterized protein n=1 Tax=Actinoallomurus acaciae TaxID=502577 RepID=A0ABV5Y993_9ACTN